MSGPAPVLAATAALGRTSSQLSLSTRTSTPNLSVNFLTFAMYWSMSPWTNRLQRSTRSFAPFSGWLFHWAWASFTQIIGAAAPVATPAVAFRKSLRFMLLMLPSSRRSTKKSGEPGSARGIENERELRCKADGLARVELVALAHDGIDVQARELAENLGVGAGGLDHHDLDRQAVVRHGEVFRPHADNHLPARNRCVAGGDRQELAGTDLDARRRDLAREE